MSRLKRYGVIYHSNAERMSKGQLLHARDQFNQNGGTVSGAPVSVCVGLMHQVVSRAHKPLVVHV